MDADLTSIANATTSKPGTTDQQICALRERITTVARNCVWSYPTEPTAAPKWSALELSNASRDIGMELREIQDRFDAVKGKMATAEKDKITRKIVGLADQEQALKEVLRVRLA